MNISGEFTGIESLSIEIFTNGNDSNNNISRKRSKKFCCIAVVVVIVFIALFYLHLNNGNAAVTPTPTHRPINDKKPATTATTKTSTVNANRCKADESNGIENKISEKSMVFFSIRSIKQSCFFFHENMTI